MNSAGARYNSVYLQSETSAFQASERGSGDVGHLISKAQGLGSSPAPPKLSRMIEVQGYPGLNKTLL